MIKVSEERSALRRFVLVKAADAYSDLMNGYANANRGLVGAGARVAVNDNLRKSGYPPTQGQKPTATPAMAVRPDIKQQLMQDFRNNYRTNRAALSRAYGQAKARLGSFVSGFRQSAQKPSPVVGAAAAVPSLGR